MNPRLSNHACITGGLLAVFVFCGCISNHGLRTGLSADCEMRQGGIVRGPTQQRRLALVFTGHDYAESTGTILEELARHQARASFFLTGVFLTNRQFAPLVGRMKTEGHYLGPHSDAHLLYCDWSASRKTLVTRTQFEADLRANVAKLPAPSAGADELPRFFLPAFEQYNSEIADWSSAAGFVLVNFTPGTRSNADYTGEADGNFVSSQVIFDSILKREREDPHGLNGFILLLHLGSGPGRADKFAGKFGALLDNLSAKGYEFVRIDDLLAAQTK